MTSHCHYEPTFASDLLKQLDLVEKSDFDFSRDSMSTFCALSMPYWFHNMSDVHLSPLSYSMSVVPSDVQLLSSSCPTLNPKKKSSLIFPDPLPLYGLKPVTTTSTLSLCPSSIPSTLTPCQSSIPSSTLLLNAIHDLSSTLLTKPVLNPSSSLTFPNSSPLTFPNSSPATLSGSSTIRTCVKFKVNYFNDHAIIPSAGLVIDLPSLKYRKSRLWKMGNLIQAILYFLIHSGCTRHDAADKFNVPYSILSVYLKNHVRKIK